MMAEFEDEKEQDVGDYEYEEIPDEEKLEIAKHFLLSSPAGEMNAVLKDVKALCPDSILTDEVLENIFHVYNVKNQQLASAGKDKIILAPQTEIDSTHYIDSKNKKVVAVDHIKGAVIKEETLEPSNEDEEDENKNEEEECTKVEDSSAFFCTEHEKLREACEISLEKYVASQYGSNTATTCVVVKEETIHLLISGEKTKFSNFWSGRWNSCFSYDPSSNEIEGKVDVLIHYFEDGNVQMNTSKKVPCTTVEIDNSEDENATSIAIVKEIARLESKIQSSLEKMYLSMGEATFKDMRRILPINRQRMDWSGAQMQIAKGFAKNNK
mmetsp:Transcript_2657/g.3082  ORF Transcript_2657/g.3082 Transcript_2657/m.3082 type:complete len:325 (+) Transcript_2657:377-1351(+)